MATDRNFIPIIREIRGSAPIGVEAYDGIHWELTKKDVTSTGVNTGIYGHMKDMRQEIVPLAEEIGNAVDLLVGAGGDVDNVTSDSLVYQLYDIRDKVYGEDGSVDMPAQNTVLHLLDEISTKLYGEDPYGDPSENSVLSVVEAIRDDVYGLSKDNPSEGTVYKDILDKHTEIQDHASDVTLSKEYFQSKEVVLDSVSDNIVGIENISSNIDILDPIGVVLSSDNNYILDVSDNLNTINTVSNNIINVNTVSTNIVEVTELSRNTEALVNVSNNISVLETVGDSIESVVSVNNSIADIQAIEDSLPVVTTVANDLNSNDSVVRLVGSEINNIKATADTISAFQDDGNYDKVISIADNLAKPDSEIKYVSDNITAVVNVDNFVDSVEYDTVLNVMAKESTLDAIETAIPNITEVADNLTSVNTVVTNIDSINSVSANETTLQLISDEMDSTLKPVVDLSEELISFTNSLNEIAVVTNNSDSLHIVADDFRGLTDSITRAGETDEEINDIDSAGSVTEDVTETESSGSVTELLQMSDSYIRIVADGIKDIEQVVDLIAEIDKVADSADEIHTVSLDLVNEYDGDPATESKIFKVANGIAEIKAVEPHLADIQVVAGKVDEIEEMNNISLNAVTQSEANAKEAVDNADLAIEAKNEVIQRIDEASISATNAKTSEDNAKVSEDNAKVSELEATNQASIVDGLYKDFHELYLGDNDIDPTQTPAGAALVDGMIYANTTSNTPKIYLNGAWRAAIMDTDGAMMTVNNLSDIDDASEGRTNLGLVIGTDVLAHSDEVIYQTDLTPVQNDLTAVINNTSTNTDDITVLKTDVQTNTDNISDHESRVTVIEEDAKFYPNGVDSHITDTVDGLTLNGVDVLNIQSSVWFNDRNEVFYDGTTEYWAKLCLVEEDSSCTVNFISADGSLDVSVSRKSGNIKTSLKGTLGSLVKVDTNGVIWVKTGVMSTSYRINAVGSTIIYDKVTMESTRTDTEPTGEIIVPVEQTRLLSDLSLVTEEVSPRREVGYYDKGINFTGDLPTEANTLKKYEKNTWVPALYVGGVEQSADRVANVHAGDEPTYVRVGDTVRFQMYVAVDLTELDDNGNADNTDDYVQLGLPFTISGYSSVEIAECTEFTDRDGNTYTVKGGMATSDKVYLYKEYGNTNRLLVKDSNEAFSLIVSGTLIL